MGEKLMLICETCLSSNRRLIDTSRILSILREIHSEELNRKVICWECHSIIMKFHTLKVQARHAQVELQEKFQTFTSLSKLLHSIKQNYDFEFIYDYTSFTNENKKEKLESLIKYESDLHSDYENDDKKVTVFVECLDSKEEILPKNKRSHLEISIKKSEINQQTMNFECLDKDEILPKKKRSFQEISKKKLEKNQRISKTSFTHDKTLQKKALSSNRKKDIDSAVLKEKFKTILLTEEEMLRSREEKRNHPNYKKIPYKCDSCVLGFTKKDNYDAHFIKKHDEAVGSYVCDVCAVRFVSALSLTRHRSLHFIRYTCSLCTYKTTAVKAAVNHCRDKHASDQIDKIHCKQCPAVFRTSEELTTHTRTEHILFCKVCGEKFKGKHTLRAHEVRIHAVKREFVCEVCKRQFATRSRLESHVARHSAAHAQRLAYCTLCRLQYKSIQVYRSHVQNSANHGTRRYQCPECNKKFASKIYRTKHYNFYHLKKSQHKCHSCNKLFISEWRLKNHRQKHHGLPRSRDHECKDCGKKFYTSTALSVHGATHSGARRLLCARCGATYRHAAALYTHERRAHCKQTD